MSLSMSSHTSEHNLTDKGETKNDRFRTSKEEDIECRRRRSDAVEAGNLL